VPTEILDRHYKTGPSAEHFAKFHAGRPTRLGDLARKKNQKFGAKPNVSLPGALSPTEKKLGRKVKFPRHQSHVARTQMHWHTPNAHCRRRVGQHERL